MDRGEIGLVAEAQMAMSRQDLSSEAVASRIKPSEEQLLDLKLDLVAPMAFDQETLGIIALEGVGRDSTYVKAALQVMAQMGAQALSIAAAYSRMKVSAELDGLTGVYNKSHLTHMLSELVYTAACAAYDKRGSSASGPRKLSTISILLFDIDHFKNYNDVNGHLAGDKLLRELAQLVQNSTRSDDVFGRFGGEEFLLILPNATLSQAVLVGEKVRKLIAAKAFPHAAGQPLGMVSVSGGVAEYPFDGLDADSLVKTADDLLYQAKKKGRNQVAAPDRYVPEEQPARKTSGTKRRATDRP
jgi:diguanylate cyclase (GGDEF)-like protein